MTEELKQHQELVEQIKSRGGSVYIDPEVDPTNHQEDEEVVLDKDNLIIGMLEDGHSYYKIMKDLSTSYYKIKKIKEQLGL